MLNLPLDELEQETSDFHVEVLVRANRPPCRYPHVRCQKDGRGKAQRLPGRHQQASHFDRGFVPLDPKGEHGACRKEGVGKSASKGCGKAVMAEILGVLSSALIYISYPTESSEQGYLLEPSRTSRRGSALFQM